MFGSLDKMHYMLSRGRNKPRAYAKALFAGCEERAGGQGFKLHTDQSERH